MEKPTSDECYQCWNGDYAHGYHYSCNLDLLTEDNYGKNCARYHTSATELKVVKKEQEENAKTWPHKLLPAPVNDDLSCCTCPHSFNIFDEMQMSTWWCRKGLFTHDCNFGKIVGSGYCAHVCAGHPDYPDGAHEGRPE